MIFFFIKNPNLTKIILAVWRDGDGCVARESDFFFQNPSLKKKVLFLRAGGGWVV